MRYEVKRDDVVPDQCRVEAIDYDNEGVCYVAIFSGPKATERAIEYAEWKESTAPAAATNGSTDIP